MTEPELTPCRKPDRESWFSLPEGYAYLRFPAELDEQSYEWFVEWLELMKRSGGRNLRSHAGEGEG